MLFRQWTLAFQTGGSTQGKGLPKPRRRAFDLVVLLVERSIWLERNDRVFNRSLSTRGALSRKIMLASEGWPPLESRLLYPQVGFGG
jgi:hypothetical protein